MSLFYRHLKDDAAFKSILEIISKAEEWSTVGLNGKDEAWEELLKGVKNALEDLKVADRSVVLGKKVHLNSFRYI